MRWWILAAAAAVVLLLALTGMLLGARADTRRAQPAPVAVLPGAAHDAGTKQKCVDEDFLPPPIFPDEEGPPLLLFGTGARFSVDGKPVVSTGDAPRHFAPGEHEVAVKLGEHAWKARLGLDPYVPAAVVAEPDATVGLVVYTFGARCSSCKPPDRGEGDIAPGVEPSTREPAEILKEAWVALAAGDWESGGGLLSHMPLSQRKGTWLKLLVVFHQQLEQDKSMRASLKLLEVKDRKASEDALSLLEKLAVTETARAGQVHTKRWNALTERYGRILEKAGIEAQGPVAQAQSRMSELSAGFQKAVESKNLTEQAAIEHAGEEALGQFVKLLRRSHPSDCSFQSKVTAAF